MSQKKQNLKIVVTQNGPYLVHGDSVIVRKKQITSEHGEPMTWQTNEVIDTGDRSVVELCRCGASSNKPFCDGTHKKNEFDGTETAAAAASQKTNPIVTAHTAPCMCKNKEKQ